MKPEETDKPLSEARLNQLNQLLCPGRYSKPLFLDMCFFFLLLFNK
jgi:hypothetical protein